MGVCGGCRAMQGRVGGRAGEVIRERAAGEVSVVQPSVLQ